MLKSKTRYDIDADTKEELNIQEISSDDLILRSAVDRNFAGKLRSNGISKKLIVRLIKKVKRI